MTDLTKIVQEAQKEVGRREIENSVQLNEKLLTQQYVQLLKLVFGEEYSASSMIFGNNVPIDHPRSGFRSSDCMHSSWLYLKKEVTTRFFKKKKLTPVQAVNFTKAVNSEGYNNLRINVLVPEAMEKAKVFAVAYEKLSGKKVTIIKDYETPGELEAAMAKVAPEVVKAKKRHNPPIFEEAPVNEAQVAKTGKVKSNRPSKSEEWCSDYEFRGFGFEMDDEVVIVKNLGENNMFLYGGATTYFHIGLKGVVRGIKNFWDGKYVAVITEKGGFSAHPEEIKKV